MYTMKADGVVFYDPASDDMSLQVLSPKAECEVNVASTLTFTLLPGNVMYDHIHKMKTIITLEQDGEEIFRGRALETTTDLYNQREVYCEGDLAFLMDSLQRPYEFDGTAADLFRLLIDNHNAQVDEVKRFTVGVVTAVDDEDTVEAESDVYTDTSSEIRARLLDVYGGYLRTRTEGDVCYIDYIAEYNTTCTQKIEFAANLVDFEQQSNALDVFTVLVPLGADQLTIESVNDGLDYIEDEEAIAQYGRIVKSYTWDDVEDAATLMELGREHMDSMEAAETLELTAVDLHLLNPDVDSIRLGDTVELCSTPHGLNKFSVCSAITLQIEDPEKTVYSFGLPKVTLTDSMTAQLNAHSNALNDLHLHLTESEEALNVYIEWTNLIGHRTTQLELDMDAAEAAIVMKADQQSVDVLAEQIRSAELRIDANEAAILLKASQETVDDLGYRMSTAEVRIDGMNSEISLLAEEIRVSGFLTVEDSAAIAQALTAQDVYCNSLNATSSVWTEYISAYDVTTAGLSVSGTEASWKEVTIVTGGQVNVTRELSPYFYDSSNKLTTFSYVTDANFVPYTKTISYLGV